LGGDENRSPEIRNLQHVPPVLAAHQDVLRFQIPVKQVTAVQKIQG